MKSNINVFDSFRMNWVVLHASALALSQQILIGVGNLIPNSVVNAIMQTERYLTSQEGKAALPF